MIVLALTAFGSGIATALILTPLSPLAAVVTAPLVASLCTALVAILLASRGPGASQAVPTLDAQTDEMVAALRGIARQGQTSAPAPAREGRAA